MHYFTISKEELFTYLAHAKHIGGNFSLMRYFSIKLALPYSTPLRVGMICKGEELKGIDFSKTNLWNTDFPNTFFGGCDFSGCDMEHSNFSNCNFTDAIFDKNTKVKHINFYGSDFTNAKIDDVDFSQSDIDNAIGIVRKTTKVFNCS